MTDILLSKLLEFFVNAGYPGLFIVSLGFPVPTELVIAILASAKEANIWIISLVSALGVLGGSLFAYFLGYIFTEKNLYRWLNSKARFLGVDTKKIERSRKQILKHSFMYMLVTRFIPWLRVPASMAAGFLRVNIFSYCISVFLGGYIYALAISYIGTKVGRNIDVLVKKIGILDKWILLIFVIYILCWYSYKYRKTISKYLISLKKKSS